MTAVRDCSSCGHANTGDAMFCSKCGARLPKAAPSEPAPSSPEPAPSEPAPSEPAAPAADVEATAVDAPEPDPPKRAAKRRVAGQAKTMLGMPAPEQAAALAAAREKAARIAQEKKDKKGDGGAKKKKKPERRIPGSARTMLGMPAPGGDVEAAVAEAKRRVAEGEGEPAKSGTSPERALDPTTNRTMLGQPAPQAARSEPPPGQEPAKRPSQRPRGLAESGSERTRAPVMYPTDSLEAEAFTIPQRRVPKGLAVAVLVAGVLILLIGAGALIHSLVSAGPVVQAAVVQGEEGEVLELGVPGAEEGTRLRFRGAEEPLEAGTARFPLSADDLALGDNELTVDVVDPDGNVSTATVALHLEMRVRADVGPLQSSTPAIDVVVEAPAGSEVTLDGEALALDAQGRGTRRFPIDGSDASAEGVVEHVVRYRVQPPEGDTAQGELRTRIPLTTMTLDRPGEDVVTEAASVEVAGAVAPGSTVTVDGEEVEVRMGRFVHRVALELGERTIEVSARAPGKAPRVARIEVRRVADLAAEAASFDADASLTYPRIAQSPTTYRGQRVALEGTVYNVEVSNGRTVLQILVTDCDRCPLWVTYPAATDIENHARVRVLGTVAGEQQFRSQSGAVRTVPRVDATYVLPVEERRRR